MFFLKCNKYKQD